MLKKKKSSFTPSCQNSVRGSHLLILMGIKAANSMEFLESQSLAKVWNTPECQAQVNSLTCALLH